MSEQRARWRVNPEWQRNTFHGPKHIICEYDGDSGLVVRKVAEMTPEDAAQVIADRERVEELEAALEDMVDQFAYRWEHDGKTTFITGGLSALENAFMALGLDDPYTVDRAALARPAATGDGAQEDRARAEGD